MNANREQLNATTDVAPVNFGVHALFSQIDMTLKDTLVIISNNTYPYKAYIETLTANKVNSQHRCGTKTQITFPWTTSVT